jgi:MoxR-like ATPase
VSASGQSGLLPENQHDDEPSATRRAAESYLRNADEGSPFAILAASEELRDQTAAALQRVLEASMASGPGETRTQKLLRRYEAARQELNAADYALAADWRLGKRTPTAIRALTRLRATAKASHERIEATPDGLVAAKHFDLLRYARELGSLSRFAVTPSRDLALDELLEAVMQGRPVLMLGPSGTGKTTLVQELARRLRTNLEVINGNEVTAGQLWGRTGLDPVKGDVIRDGIVARAMVQDDGSLLLWDEANASEEAMEKFLKFKVYLTARAGDLVRVPPENPTQRAVGPKFGFILTGNPKGQKHTNRADFPPEIARELTDVNLDYLPEEEMFDLALASLAKASETLPVGIEEVRMDGVLHNLVKLVHEIQNLYLGMSTARATTGTPTLRKLVIDPGKVTAWLGHWPYVHAKRGETLATFIDQQLVALANSEKYPAEDRALLVQTAGRFHFLATAQAKAGLRVPGLAPAALTAFTPFSPDLYAANRETTLSLNEAVQQHPYLTQRLAGQYTAALNAIAQKTGKPAADVQALLIGSSIPEQLRELQHLAKVSPEDLAAIFDTATASGATAPPPAAPAPGAPPAAPPRPVAMPDLLRPTWGVDEMKAWLQATLAADGDTLESKLEGKSFDKQVQKYVRGFADGTRGFALDLTKVRFPHDALTLARLKEGIEAGAITGIVIEAYPDAAQLDTIANKVNPANPALERDKILRESVVDFLANHFQARTGKVWDIANRLAQWRKMKWPPRNGEPLWKAFHERAAQNGHDIATDYVDANGARTQAYKDDHAGIYADLDDQPIMQDMLGTVSVVFANTKRDVPKTSKILGADGITSLTHGEGLSSIALLQHKVDTLTPAEDLALAAAMSTPGDTNTYPDPKTWVWLAGIDPQYAAYAASGSVGLGLPWDGPERSNSDTRVRSVVR